MYIIALGILIAISVGTRLLYIDSYPFGFSGHAIVHSHLRRKLYELIFVSPWGDNFWPAFRSLVVEDHHGSQSLLEALLTPIFGAGITESRLIVSTIGLISIALVVMWGTTAINKWFGLAVGLAVSVAPYHLTYSRNGDSEHINIYLFSFLILLAAQRIITKGKIWDYLLLGVATGASFYFYAPVQMLALLVLGFLALLKFREVLRLPAFSMVLRLAAFFVPAFFLIRPVVYNSWSHGRLIPVHVPYGTPSYTFSTWEEIPASLVKTWNELFVQGTDPWFSRFEGCMRDWVVLLAVPGCAFLIYALSAAYKQKRGAEFFKPKSVHFRSILFCVAITLGLVAVGWVPGAMSPAPHFRRLTLFAIGIDILMGAGIYVIGLILLRYLPKVLASLLILVGVGALTYEQWNTFYNKISVSESTCKNSPVAIAREVRTRMISQREVNVLFLNEPGLLPADEMLYVLTFDLNYPAELPKSLKLRSLEDVQKEPFTDLIIPADSYERLARDGRAGKLGIVFSNPRVISNRAGQTHIIVDTKPLSSAK